MVKSKIHQKYHPKAKKWEFSQIFALFCSKEDVDEVMDVLQEYNLQKVNSRSFLNYLNEKLLALGAFNGAKKEV